MSCRFFCVVVVSYHAREREREGGRFDSCIYLSIGTCLVCENSTYCNGGWISIVYLLYYHIILYHIMDVDVDLDGKSRLIEKRNFKSEN